MGAIKINGSTSGSTTITAPATGSDESIELSTALAAKAPLASPTFTGTVALPATTTLDGSTLSPGKILQIVRATDSTSRSTSSTSVVDANISVTITPQKSDSAIIIIWNPRCSNDTSSGRSMGLYITDNSNNVISGAEQAILGSTNASAQGVVTCIAYATPATTSAVTYKGRFVSSTTAAVTINNDLMTGQMYAIEVAA